MSNESKAAAHLERRFGRGIKTMREARGWSQTELAERLAELGFEYHQTTIGKIESAARPLRLSELFAFAGVFGIPASDMLAATGSTVNPDSFSVDEEEHYAARSRERFIAALDEYVEEQIIIRRRRDAAVRDGGLNGEHPEAP